MIIRLVQMTFHAESTDNFLRLFDERKQTIKGFEGCMHLELWQDTRDTNTFFTYSIWESEKHLDHYRFSEFFKDTWGETKSLFDKSPKAWSVNQRVIV